MRLVMAQSGFHGEACGIHKCDQISRKVKIFWVDFIKIYRLSDLSKETQFQASEHDHTMTDVTLKSIHFWQFFLHL